jgi:hypothetical protein
MAYQLLLVLALDENDLPEVATHELLNRIPEDLPGTEDLRVLSSDFRPYANREEIHTKIDYLIDAVDKMRVKYGTGAER